MEKAGLGMRAVATFLDSAVFSLIFVFGGAILGFPTEPTPEGKLLLYGTLTLAFVVYLFGEGLYGITPGKLMTKLKVVGPQGNTPGLKKSAVRNTLRLVDFLPVYYVLGAAVIYFTEDNQRIGDLAADTRVVSRN